MDKPNSLLDVHGEVSLDFPLRDEGTTHAGQCLPAGEHSRGIYLLQRNPGCLLDQLDEHLEREREGGRGDGRKVRDQRWVGTKEKGIGVKGRRGKEKEER